MSESLSIIRRTHTFILILLCVFLPSTNAAAAGLRTEVAARKVGVGQSFEVRVTALRKDGEPEPTLPRLALQGEASVQGPSISTQRRVTMRNFSFDSEQSVVATWTLTARAVGKLVIGPATFQVGSKTLRGEVIEVQVVEADPRLQGQDPFSKKRRSRGLFGGKDPSGGSDPFNMFSRRRRTISDLPSLPKRLHPRRAPDEIAFLQAFVDKKEAVLGETVRLVVWAYGKRGNFREVSPTEPSLADFLSYSVVESSHDEPAYKCELGGSLFIARKLREYILVPLKTGSSDIGSMSAVLQGTRPTYPKRGSPHGYKILSPPLSLSVKNSPKKGRPLGFVPGDVGRYKLSVEISPRELKEGEFSELIVQIKGVGQIPSELRLPPHSDLIWEPPTLRGGPEVIDGKLQGSRVLKFALQAKKSGQLQLGDVTLPYFDPSSRRYKVARAQLGTLTVEKLVATAPKTGISSLPRTSPPPSNQAPGASPDDEPLAPRRQSLPWNSSRSSPVPTGAWAMLFVFPVLIALGSAFRHLLGAISTRRGKAKKSSSPAKLKEARNAFEVGDNPSGFRLLEGALYDELATLTGCPCRGFLRTELSDVLVQAGLKKELALESQEILEQSEKARYDDSSLSQKELLLRTDTLIREFASTKLSIKGSSSAKGRVS